MGKFFQWIGFDPCQGTRSRMSQLKISYAAMETHHRHINKILFFLKGDLNIQMKEAVSIR